jgi:hypothetical protein
MIDRADLTPPPRSQEDVALALTNLAGFLDTIGPHQRNDRDEDYCYDSAQLVRDVTVWLAERDALAARLDAVRELHSQTHTFHHPWGETTTCHHCGHERPCPTERAILDNREDPR